MKLRPELTSSCLETHSDRIGGFPVEEDEILSAVAIDVEDVDGLHATGQRQFLWFGQGVVGRLRQDRNEIFAQHGDIRFAVAVEISDGQAVGSELCLVQLPLPWGAPGQFFLVVVYDKLKGFGFAKVDNVGKLVIVEVGDH